MTSASVTSPTPAVTAPRVVFPVSRALQRILILSVAAAGPLAGQHQPPTVAKVTVPPPRPLPRTYWKEGAAIGGAIVGTTMAWVVYGLGCEFSDVSSDCSAGQILAGGVVGGLAGGIVGGLIGGAFSAPEQRVARPGRMAAVGAGAGALWGFGVFSRFCLNGCHTEEVVLGLSTTAVGAVAGWLIGH